MVSEKLKLGSEFQIDHSDKTDTFDVLKHFTGIDLEQERETVDWVQARKVDVDSSPYIPGKEKEASSTLQTRL